LALCVFLVVLAVFFCFVWEQRYIFFLGGGCVPRSQPEVLGLIL
jgi:hypothetical protein